MKTAVLAFAALLLCPASCISNQNLTDSLTSRITLPANFRPPQVFRNINLLRTVNLEKGYARETIAVVVENVDKKPQDEYFLPFENAVVDKVGGLEVRDKKQDGTAPFKVALVDYDIDGPIQYYRIKLPQPLKPKGQLTLSITYSVLSSLKPLPAKTGQMDVQYLTYTFSAYTPSAYVTSKQKTKVKFSGNDVPEYTKIPKNAEGKEDPQKQGSTFTYGPYNELPAGASEPVTVRYEFTKPVLHATLVERDVEISHWGGNIATEERYWLVNNGAELSNHFSPVSWATTQYYNPPTRALKEIKMPLKVGSTDAYFVDDIGNVSTSHFRSGLRDAHLELKPRYPLFGGWKYNFKVGWNNNLRTFLRKLEKGDTYILKVPFMEGPRQPEGVEYEKFHLRVILPEGAKNIRSHTTMPVDSVSESLHKTFMDTQGRPTLHLHVTNVVDDLRDRDLIVMYDYSLLASIRKPVTIFLAIMGVFISAYGVGRIDTRIGKGS